MITVYEVREHIDFQILAAEDRTNISPLARRLNNPIGDIEFPTFYIQDLKLKRGNFFRLAHNVMAFDDVAHKALSEITAPAGENYIIDVDDFGTLNALNVTETCNGLDHTRTVWDERDGKKICVSKYMFDPNTIKTQSGLFKLEEDLYSIVYAVTGLPNQSGDFYSSYQNANLTGLRFDEVWNSEQ